MGSVQKLILMGYLHFDLEKKKLFHFDLEKKYVSKALLYYFIFFKEINPNQEHLIHWNVIYTVRNRDYWYKIAYVSGLNLGQRVPPSLILCWEINEDWG